MSIHNLCFLGRSNLLICSKVALLAAMVTFTNRVTKIFPFKTMPISMFSVGTLIGVRNCLNKVRLRSERGPFLCKNCWQNPPTSRAQQAVRRMAYI